MIVDLLRLAFTVAAAVVVTRRVATAQELARPGYHIDKNGDIHEQPEGRGLLWQARHVVGLEPTPTAMTTTNRRELVCDLRASAEAMAAEVRKARDAGCVNRLAGVA